MVGVVVGELGLLMFSRLSKKALLGLIVGWMWSRFYNYCSIDLLYFILHFALLVHQ